MNLFETLIAIALSIATFFLAHWLAVRTDNWGWLIFVPVIYFWFHTLKQTFAGIVRDAKESGRPRPPCRQGKCTAKDYVLIESTPNYVTFRCRCGDTYMSQGTYFTQILPGGVPVPYMKHDRSGKWVPDTGVPS